MVTDSLIILQILREVLGKCPVDMPLIERHFELGTSAQAALAHSLLWFSKDRSYLEANWCQQTFQTALRPFGRLYCMLQCVASVLVLSAERHAQAGSHNGDDEGDDEEARRADLRLLAHTLVGFAAQQDLRLDTFAMGPASRALGHHPQPPSTPKFTYLASQFAAYTPFAHPPIPSQLVSSETTSCIQCLVHNGLDYTAVAFQCLM